jgi:hypothetical protein
MVLAPEEAKRLVDDHEAREKAAISFETGEHSLSER